MTTITLPARYNDMMWQERREVRIEYVRIQGGKCRHCEAPLDGDPPQKIMHMPINWQLFPVNFLKHPVHLHHSHKTGMTLGAVHARCNAVLWQHHGE